MIQATDIKVHTKTGRLEVAFSTGETVSIEAEILRVYSPSAEVKGHGMEPPILVRDKERVKILHVDVVGNYALRIQFDDLHDSGIYTWEYLYDLGLNQEAYRDMYEKRKKTEGTTG